MKSIFEFLLLLFGIPFGTFMLIIFAHSAYSPIRYHYLSLQKKKELQIKLDEYDLIEQNNPELFDALEKMKFYRMLSFVFIFSYLILFALEVIFK